MKAVILVGGHLTADIRFTQWFILRNEACKWFFAIELIASLRRAPSVHLYGG